MKIIFLFMLSVIFISINADELSWVDTQIEAILPNRVGIDKSSITKVKNPFIFLLKNKSSKKKNSFKSNSTKKYHKKKRVLKHRRKRLILDAIMNNSALINGKWYKLGETINSYKIVKIEQNSIFLTKDKIDIELSTVSKIQNLNFSR